MARIDPVITPEQEAELVEEMAAEICYAAFVPPIDYGGPKVYWRTVVPKRKEAYRREARAALRIAKSVIRDEALGEATLECVPKENEAWSRDMVLGGIISLNRINALKSKGQKP